MRIKTGLILIIISIMLLGINPPNTNTVQAAGNCDQPPIAVNDKVILYGRLTNIEVYVLRNDSDPGKCRIRIKEFTRGGRGHTRLHYNAIWYSYQGLIQPLTDSFTYTIVNSAGKTATATVEILLYPPNLRPPVTQDDSFTTYVGYWQPFEVVSNDSDPDAVGTGLGLDVEALNFDKSKLTAYIYKYHPTIIAVRPYETGQYTISYTVVSTATGLSATGTLHLNVIVPPPPIANEDVVTVKPGQMIQIDVLKNDVPAIQDIPRSRRYYPLSIVGLDQTQPQPTLGKVQFQTLYQRKRDYMVYTANHDAVGVDVFYYILKERFGVTAVGKVTVIIQP